MLRITVLRNNKSYDFKADPNKPSGFDNNWKNNSMDWFILSDDDAELIRCRCQSVANYCFGDMASGDFIEHGDTIAPGLFTVKCFVEPRAFHGEIHAITKTKDIDGQWIDRNAMQTTKDGYQNGRWLIHDRFSFKQNADTTYAWSAGCIILSSGDLEAINMLLHAYKIQPGDEISGEIVEETEDEEDN